MITGGCLCGAYRFEVNGEFKDMMDCHCSMCRKAHGAAFATFAGCDSASFKLLDGEDCVTKYQSSAEGTRSFCKMCGAPLPMVMGDKTYVPAGLLDDDPGVKTSAHYFVESKAPWVEITDDATQYNEYPG